MPQRPATIALLRDPRLAALATRAAPAWLFDPSGRQLLFANPAGAALLGFATCSAATTASFDNTDIAAQMARSAQALQPDGPSRLERLRGVGMGKGASIAARRGPPLFCACSKITLDDGEGVLVVASEAVEPALPLAEQARRLIDGGDAVAAFDVQGALLYATAAAVARLDDATQLADVYGGERLRVGDDDAMTLVVFEDDEAADAQLEEPTDEQELAPDVAHEAELSEHAKEGASGPSFERAAPQPLQDEAVGEEDDKAPRRHPLRFVWQTDADNRFTITDRDFLDLAAPRTTKLMGRFWNEVAAKLALDPEGTITHAMVSRKTWSGVGVDWPARDGSRIRVTLCGIPIFDDDNLFAGYRGWGMCGSPETCEDAASTDSAPIPASNDSAPREPQPAAPAPIKNVVPFRSGAVDARPALTASEPTPLQSLTSRLASRLNQADDLARGRITVTPPALPDAAPAAFTQEQTARAIDTSPSELSTATPILDRLPVGLLLYRRNQCLYANPAFLTLTGHHSLTAFNEAGGLDGLFIETLDTTASNDIGTSLRIAAPARATAMDGRLVTLPIDGEDTSALVLFPHNTPQQSPRQAQRADQPSNLSALIDLATDGVVVVDRNGTILEANDSAARLFGYETDELSGRAFTSLFAPDSERFASASLERLVTGAQAGPIDDGRDYIGKRRHGSLLMLNILFARAEANSARYYAIFRDITHWKNTEKDLTAARQAAEKASSAKSDFLTRISHEMRTPLNAIIGFADVMMEERFGPLGNERYRDYLKDIKLSGSHLVSLLNDLLDLSKVEAGQMEMTFERVNLNDLTQQSVAIMQAQANQERIIIRTALSMNVPPVMADARSVRQIILNLLSNSIKFTPAGGQVIVSTAATDRGDVMLRVRDTGIGMSEDEVEMALQPFRQIGTAAKSGPAATTQGAGPGTGLGLPLTKALTEANRARFSIKSDVNAGTLVEIVFPLARLLAD